MMSRSYSELIELPSFEERFEYLKLNGKIGESLFGYSRYLNQVFYQMPELRKVRRDVIIRDRGYDLGVFGWEIVGSVYVHHMNPISLEQLKENDSALLDPEYLISTSRKTHEAITLGDASLLPKPVTYRYPNDTIPWK